jgi:hypothetical protein
VMIKQRARLGEMYVSKGREKQGRQK